MSIGLTHGEPSAAALTVAQGIEPLQQLLTDLADQVSASAVGFRGAAASGLGSALTAWFEVAATLSPILDAYASALATVDSEHATNEGVQLDRYGQLGDRLDGRLGNGMGGPS